MVIHSDELCVSIKENSRTDKHDDITEINAAYGKSSHPMKYRRCDVMYLKSLRADGKYSHFLINEINLNINLYFHHI